MLNINEGCAWKMRAGGNGKERKEETLDAIHSTKISGNFGPKLSGSVRSNRKSFEKMGPPFGVDHFSLFVPVGILVEWIAPSLSLSRSSFSLFFPIVPFAEIP